LGGNFEGGPAEKSCSGAGLPEQRLDLEAQRLISRTRGSDVRRPIALGTISSGVKERFDLLPAVQGRPILSDSDFVPSATHADVGYANLTRRVNPTFAEARVIRVSAKKPTAIASP
jgi:hypothetical protein